MQGKAVIKGLAEACFFQNFQPVRDESMKT
jgi:hypothetical protein